MLHDQMEKTESALLLFARAHLGMNPVSELRESVKTLQMIPFDSGRKCMGIVIETPKGGARLYVKGASEIILAQCTTALNDPAIDAGVDSLSSNKRSLCSSEADRSKSTPMQEAGKPRR